MMKYGHKTFSLAGGEMVLTSVTITEKPLPGEDETAFTRRLLEMYKEHQGKLELVIENGRPDYAIITLQ